MGVGGLFVYLLPAINQPGSGRAECAGMEPRRKQKGAFDGSLPIGGIDWHGNQRRVVSPPFDVGGCKGAGPLDSLLHTHTPSLPAPTMLPQLSLAPVCPVISIGACARL